MDFSVTVAYLCGTISNASVNLGKFDKVYYFQLIPCQLIQPIWEVVLMKRGNKMKSSLKI